MKLVCKRPRIVLKFGTGVLSQKGGSALDKGQIRRIAAEVAELSARADCIIVSSAAIAAGVAALGLPTRPTDLPSKQACAAVGQPELMMLYSTAFAEHGLRVAQLLLTHGDLDSRTRHSNARNTLDTIIAHGGVIPIINENDSVATEEVRFGDNDHLSVHVAEMVAASRLLLLTSTDGLMDSQGRRVKIVKKIEDALVHVRPDKGEFSVGGMQSKIEAVRRALDSGISVTILDGRKPGQIALACAGKDAGTRFLVMGQVRG